MSGDNEPAKVAEIELFGAAHLFPIDLVDLVPGDGMQPLAAPRSGQNPVELPSEWAMTERAPPFVIRRDTDPLLSQMLGEHPDFDPWVAPADMVIASALLNPSRSIDRKVSPMPDAVTITPSENGPYIVSGPVNLVAPDGHEIEHPDPMAMCRCGRSSNKPFCDGTHATWDFDGTLAN